MDIFELVPKHITNDNNNYGTDYFHPMIDKEPDSVIPGFTDDTYGESEKHAIEWQWDRSVYSESSINGLEAALHPINNPSFVRGEVAMKLNLIHYWEIKITSLSPRRDVLIGIGIHKTANPTKNVCEEPIINTSTESPKTNEIKPNKCQRFCGTSVSKCCTVGVFLDLRIGRLEFFINRRTQGTVYKHIIRADNFNIYPMVCSVGKCRIKLINSAACHESFQYHCLRALGRQPNLVEELNKIPGLKYLAEKYWFLVSTFLNTTQKKSNIPFEKRAILRYAANPTNSTIGGVEFVICGVHAVCPSTINKKYKDESYDSDENSSKITKPCPCNVLFYNGIHLDILLGLPIEEN